MSQENKTDTQEFSRRYNNSSSGVNLTPYSGDIEEVRQPQKRSYPVPKT